MSVMALDDDRVRAFLTDLLALMNQHRIGFDSCGCCGSPWLVELAEPARRISVGKMHEHYDQLELDSDGDDDQDDEDIVVRRTEPEEGA